MFELKLQQKNRSILHVDADAFFASVEQILNPKLKGKPVLVGSDSGNNGIVSAASYEARAFGVHSAMPMYLAKKKCPGAIVLPGNFKAYREFSSKMHDVFSDYTNKIEMMSIDEAFLDLTETVDFSGESAEVLARKLLVEVHEKLGLSVSGGLASGKTVAKVASGMNKPRKLTVVPFGKEKDFLASLDLRCLPGIGPKTYSGLEKYGFFKIGDFACLEPDKVVPLFGAGAIPLWKKANGVDNSEVVSDRELPKSISKEHTFYKPPASKKEALEYLRKLCLNVLSKLRRQDLKARVVFVKVRHYGRGEKPFEDVGAQFNLGELTDLSQKIFPEARKLFLSKLGNLEDLRLIGVGVSGISSVYNLCLFEKEDSPGTKSSHKQQPTGTRTVAPKKSIPGNVCSHKQPNLSQLTG